MRRGAPRSFGWLLIEKLDQGDLWETPTGYRVILDRGAWLEQAIDGYVTVIDPPATQH